MDKKNFLILSAKGKKFEFRTRRLAEEIMRRGIEIKVVFVEELNVLADRVVFDNSEINFMEYDYLISIGTPDANLYIIELARAINPRLKMWPNPENDKMRDKFAEGIFLNKLGIPTPETVLLNGRAKEFIKCSADKIGGFPCVAKKVTGASGDYVELVNSSNEVTDFIEKLSFPSIAGKRNVILQEYIKESKGTDFRVYCVGDKVLGAMKRTATNDDFKANISLGGKAQQVEVSEEMQKYAQTIMRAGNIMFAGIDFIKSDKGYLVIEINISANFEGFEAATGVNVAGKIIDQFLKK